MAARASLDDKLAAIRAIRGQVLTPEHKAELRKRLGDRSNLVVAAAAVIVGENALLALAPELESAFARFLVNPLKDDKLCRAKIAVIPALERMEYLRPDVFLKSARHVQFEPIWGGSEDSAPPLRAAALIALGRCEGTSSLPRPDRRSRPQVLLAGSRSSTDGPSRHPGRPLTPATVENSPRPGTITLKLPPLAVLGADESGGLGGVGDLAGGGVVVDRLAQPDGHVPQEHRLGENPRIGEIRQGDRRVARPDRADPLGLVVGVVVALGLGLGRLLRLLAGLADAQEHLLRAVVAWRED